jgi:hypothetical protein
MYATAAPTTAPMTSASGMRKNSLPRTSVRSLAATMTLSQRTTDEILSERDGADFVMTQLQDMGRSRA